MAMVLQSWAVDEDVVKEHDDTFAKEWLKNSIHSRLKSGRRVCEAERHDQKLKVSIMRSEGCLKDVSVMHSDLMIA